MKVGDMVEIVQSKSDELVSPFMGQVGVIVEAHYKSKFRNQCSFSIMISDRMIVMGANYIDVINEGR
jgi:hypothetical protein